jgi:signal transduction histidine kinase/DNA-binding response OmpR family regulator
MSFELSRRKDLTTLFAVLAALSTFPYLFIFSGNAIFLRYVSLGFFVLCLGCILLNRKGFHFASKHLLFLGSNLYLFVTASAFGRATGEHLIYLPVIFGAVLIYDFTEIKSLIFSISFTLICLVTLELTDYKLLSVALSPEQQLGYYYGNLTLTFVLAIIAALFYFKLYARQNIRNEQLIRTSRESEEIIAYFATSLYGKNAVNEILWDVAKNCISQLGFQDCVIYLLNEQTQRLEQKAAFGPKNPDAFEISHVITIPLGEGIVGSVAKTGMAEVIPDTSKDPRYIVDDQRRFSEITVPIVYENLVIGVIDSEHPDKNFFTDTHLRILKIIAALCSNKVVKALAEEEKMMATMARLEAEKIREVDRLKSQFYAHLSHEFRTPLTLILGPLEEMIRNAEPEEVDQLKLMQENGQRLLHLINDLLEMSRLNEGMLNLELRKGDIGSLVRTTATSFHSLAGQKQVEIEMNLPDEPIIMSYDSTKVETILINLLSNAIKFSPKGGQIAVWINVNSGYVTITVFNRGLHIPPVQLEKILERKLMSAPSEEAHPGDAEHRGIGLALSKELAVIHGGSIHVASDQSGTRFTLSIPATSYSPGKPMQTPNFVPAGDGIELEREEDNKQPVVLIVEDSEQLRLFLRRILMDDFSLAEAVNGKEGLKTCYEIVPDLVISDIMMPEMDGMELCRRIRDSEITNHIPVLMLTALADLDSKLQGLETGADYYLAKPFEPRELITVSNNLIAQRKRLREHFSRKILLKSQQWDGLNADELFLQKLVSLVEARLSDTDFTVEDIQKELGISRMQLHRKLKALTDKSATEFVRAIRLRIAAEKLQAGHDNVSQVAYQVGFNSLSYFTKCFKEEFGVIPSAYAEKNPAK